MKMLTRQSVLALIVAFLALIPTVGCTHTKVVHETKTVYRDRPTTTTTTTPPAEEEAKYSNYPGSTQFKGVAFRFSAVFPVFNSGDKVGSSTMEANSRTTSYQAYSTYLSAAQKGDKVIYCHYYSKSCSLTASFRIDVYRDNTVNRKALEYTSFWDCEAMTFTGVPGKICTFKGSPGDKSYRWSGIVTHNGFIYDIEASGKIPDEYLYYGFVHDFGFTDV